MAELTQPLLSKGTGIPPAAGCWHGQLPMENSQGMTWVCHPQHQEITWTDAGHKFSFGTNSGFNSSKTNSASPSLFSTCLCSCVHSQPGTCPALGDPTSTKGFHSNAELLYLLMIVVDILGLEHTLTEWFIKIKRIREAPSDHITNISSLNSAQSFSLLRNTTSYLLEIPTSTLHQHATSWRRKGPKHTWTLGDMNKVLTLTSNFKRHIANAKF